jgi:GT2 family glycosyltransferase
MSSLPPVSLILCSRDRPELLLASVNSILAGATLPNELIVIDQSQVRHEQLATMTGDRSCDVRYIWSQTKGLSKANNQGVKLARYDILAFTHDDVIVAEDWLHTLVSALVAVGRRAVMTGRVLPTEPEVPGGFVPTLKEDEHPHVYQGRIWEDVLYPLNMAMYRSALEEIGPFDERLGPGTRFPGGEDNDLGYRLLEAGYQIHYVPDAALYHRAWRPEEERLKLRWGYYRGQGAYYAKHWALGDPYMIRRAAVEVSHRARLMAYHLRYSRWVARNQAVSILAILSGATESLVSRWLER